MSDDEMQHMHFGNRKAATATTTTTATDQFDLYGEFNMVESAALRRKLQSKVEALRILRKELELFRTERDQFKLMAETLQLRYSAIKRGSDVYGGGLGTGSKSSVAQLLHDTRERNIKLTTEVESLKQKLVELQGDIELLRSKDERGGVAGVEKLRRSNAEAMEYSNDNEEAEHWKQERADFICHLENLKKKNAQLAFDLKAVIDEKEEIITERDAYKCKAHRLNHELHTALRANEAHPKFLDIDSILLENKYLHERLKNFENEMELTKQSMNKYKTMLESKRKKGIIKLGTSSNDESILSHKQVKNILESGIDLPTRTETIQDLKSLCLALLDNLNDKNLALSHQKKTNKILATKIAELEQRIHTLIGQDSTTEASSCNSGSGYSPSQLLLHGYCASLVDSSHTNDTSTTTTTATTAKSTCNVTEDSGTMSSEQDDSNKTSRGVGGGGGISDDGMSSLSTESGRSILSSEYGIGLGGACTLSEFTNSAMYAYKTSSTTTDSGNCVFKSSSAIANSLIPSAIAKERIDDLKDLPPELAALVQKALHELDLRDFDEVVGACEGIGVEVEETQHVRANAADAEEQKEEKNDDDGDEKEDEVTI